VAAWLAWVGFISITAAAALTLVAMGRRGRRRFLVVFAAATLVIGTYQFWTTNWVARFGDTATYCDDAGHALQPGASKRIPPGVECAGGFVDADGISWLALGGWSLFYGFAAAFPVMGLAWLIRQRPALPLPQPPGTTR
jgi:hypothetical protein